ncbi:hypothetical protein [Bacillus sp. FJAT-27264]|uniref:hypothetical protein n=1 Tax=Paenibacillus sp. (strain DSM 101736 / FJAT-27264) TaxID=1850362 RepID=UPI0009F22669|nr:hypothetical protein [Bacillus sp. FJAT-27264]
MSMDMNLSPTPNLPEAAPAVQTKADKDRSWRVGTLSMGLSLLFLGVLIMASQWNGAEVFAMTLAWWPVIFILLGLEIVIYTLWFRGKGKVYYDVMSVLFVGFLAICCLLFAAISSLGLTQEIKQMMSLSEERYELPAYSAPLPAGITKIIVQTEWIHKVKVDQTGGSALNVFGTYLSDQGRLQKEQESSLLLTKHVGDTVYIMAGTTKGGSFFNRHQNGLNVTVAHPAGVQVVVRDNYGNEL